MKVKYYHQCYSHKLKPKENLWGIKRCIQNNYIWTNLIFENNILQNPKDFWLIIWQSNCNTLRLPQGPVPRRGLLLWSKKKG